MMAVRNRKLSVSPAQAASDFAMPLTAARLSTLLLVSCVALVSCTQHGQFCPQTARDVLDVTLTHNTELLPYNPVANAKAVVTAGNARFTVLTDRLIRMEYSSSGSFEDRATVAFLNRCAYRRSS